MASSGAPRDGRPSPGGPLPGGPLPGGPPPGGPPPGGPPPGPVTLRTIAALAGVHVSTVSRALAPPARSDVRTASPDTIGRIRALAAELGYSPDPHGQGLRTRRSRLVGVIVPQLADIVLATIYEGVEEAAGEHGYSTFVANSKDDDTQRSLRTSMLLARRVDGVVLGDTPLDGRSVTPFAERGVPFVLVNRRSGDHPSVTCDDEAGGRLAAEHLLALGHRRVAVVAGAPYASTGVDRTTGFCAVYAKAGTPVPPARIVHSAFDVTGGRRAADALLDVADPPTAVFAVNDFAAIGVLGALRDRGLVPGVDVSVVGYNDVPLAAQLPVSLSTVASPMREIGRQGFTLLLDRLAGRRGASVRLAPTMVARSSSGAVSDLSDRRNRS